VKTYEEESGRPVPFEIVDRRPGDVAASWADVSKAADELGWSTTRDLAAMCADSWAWQQNAR
jgi:UDP-glucose 4-epimerase